MREAGPRKCPTCGQTDDTESIQRAVDLAAMCEPDTTVTVGFCVDAFHNEGGTPCER